MKKLFVLLALMPIGSILQAQNYQDMLRYSRFSVEGTARSAAMGGAFGALGGDLSTLSTNPAGIGVFRKSEVNFSSLLNFSHIKSKGMSGSATQYHVGNLGAVFSLSRGNTDWRGVNFGFNYTNLTPNQHTMKQFVGNESSDFSLTSIWAYQASEGLDSYVTELAKKTYLIVPTQDGYYDPIFWQGPAAELINQQKNIEEYGYLGEYAMSIGTNYKDQLYLGMTIGIQSLFQKMQSIYTEIGETDAPSGFDLFDHYEYQRVEGTGVNLKFGVIYRPISQLRLGASIHTPTWYSVDYEYETAIDAWFNRADPTIGRPVTFQGYGAIDEYDFKMRTPWRAILSVAGVLGRKAILSMDYEYVDYASARFTDNSFGYDYQDENDYIGAVYTGGHNVRIGAEYRFNSTFSLRGGYSLQQSPYKDKGIRFTYNIPQGDKLEAVSGGFGLNFGGWYVDAAYTYRFSKDRTIFYSGDGYYIDSNDATPTIKVITLESTPVSNKYNNHQARLTLGCRF